MKVRGINFSNQYTKGSVQSRRNTVERLCSKVFSEVVEAYKPVKAGKGLSMETSSVHFLKLEQLLKRTFPELINFNIIKNKKSYNYDGCIRTMFDRYSLKSYQMELPLINKVLPREKIPVFMHEVAHLLDFAINPQYKMIYESLNKKEIFCETHKLYKDLYYTDKTFQKFQILKKTNKFLKNYTTEEKLLILRYLKLQMLTEINGFSVANKYENCVPKCYISSAKCNRGNNYKFCEKIDLTDKMRYKIIKTERGKNKRKILFHKFLGINKNK